MDPTRRVTWHDHVNVRESGLAARCPRCGSDFRVGPVFDHDPRPCLDCGASLVEWNLMRFIVVIDAERAPPLVQAVISHLSMLTEPEAQDQLEDFLRAVRAPGDLE